MSETADPPVPDDKTAGKPAESAAAYRVLARKYRPRSFDDLIGQEPMVRTLTNAFETGRIAQAWMLTGVRGVGKTTTARILARALNYETETIDQPTIHMRELGIHCPSIMEGRHVDVVEMDAASHTGIDDVREIIAQVRYRPVSARYKVYIIDEVHMLSTQAFNGLLKTLEEPPEHVKFVFATTEIRKVPITVLSRCQRFDLRRVDSATLIAHLTKIAAAESVPIDDGALRLISRAAEGSVRDALSLTDQAIAHGAGAISAEAVRDMLGLADRVRIIDLFEHLMKGDGAAALKELREQYVAGADPAVVLSDLADFTHLVTTLRYVPEAAEDAALSPMEVERGLTFSTTLSIRTLGQVWQMLLQALEETRNATAPRQAAEMALIRIAHAADLPSPDALLTMIRDGGLEALPAPVAGAGSGSNGQGGGPAKGGPAGGAASSAPAASASKATVPAPSTGTAPAADGPTGRAPPRGGLSIAGGRSARADGGRARRAEGDGPAGPGRGRDRHRLARGAGRAVGGKARFADDRLDPPLSETGAYRARPPGSRPDAGGAADPDQRPDAPLARLDRQALGRHGVQCIERADPRRDGQDAPQFSAGRRRERPGGRRRAGGLSGRQGRRRAAARRCRGGGGKGRCRSLVARRAGAEREICAACRTGFG